jgi:hypothetical protein
MLLAVLKVRQMTHFSEKRKSTTGVALSRTATLRRQELVRKLSSVGKGVGLLRHQC